MLRVEGLCLRYPKQDQPLLRHLSFSLGQGELLWLKGPNGSGKTSLLNALSGIIPQRVRAELAGSITLGDIDLGSVPLNEKFRHLAYQMSDPDHQIFFPRVTKELSFALENSGMEASQMLARVSQTRELFGLDEFGQVEPGQLSRGQKKLLTLAVCAALDPPLYLLDEPASALSPEAINCLLNWLRGILAAGRMVVVAEHDPVISGLATSKLEFGA